MTALAAFFLFIRRFGRRSLAALLACSALLLAAAPAAACSTGGCVSAGPRLASISSSRGALLNALLGNLTGSTLNLSVADWNAIAAGDLSLLKTLNALQAQLGVSSPTTALTANASLAQILAAAATAATGDNRTALAASLGSLQGQVNLLSGSIRLGDLLQTDGGLGETRLNALELISGAIQLYNTRNVLTTPSALTLSGASLGLGSLLGQVSLAAQVIEPPVYVCGPSGTSFHSAAIRVKLNLDLITLNLDTSGLTSLLGISGITLQVGHLDLYVELGRANGIIAAVDALAGSMSVQVSPGVADLYLGQISDSVFFNRGRALTPADVTPGIVGALKIGSTTVAVTVQAYAKGQAPSSTLLSFSGAYPQTRTAYTQAAFASNLLSSLVGNLQLGVTPSLGVLDAVVLPVVKLLVQGVVAPLLGNVLSGLVDPLLELIGLRIGEIDVTSGGTFKVCSISGSVYNDANHSAVREAGEAGTGVALYVKLVPASTPSGPAISVATVDSSSGGYTLGGVGVGSYLVVVSTSAAPAASTATAPGGWIATEVPTLSRSLTLATDTSAQNFGLYNGARLTGTVFQDTGKGGGTANNGARDGAEPGRVGATLVLSNAAGTVVIDRITTGDQGGFTTWIPAASAGAVKLAQTDAGDWISVAGNAGTTGGTYTLATDALVFTATSGTSYAGVLFADVPANRFDTDGQQSVLPGAVAFYAHGYTAGSAGQLSFAASGQAPAGWSSMLYADTNCNGKLDAGELPITGPSAVVAEQRVCIVAKVTSPAQAAAGTQYPLVLVATLAYANNALVGTAQRGDVTIVGNAADAGLRLTKQVDKASAAIGDTLTYTISYVNQGTTPLSALKIVDATPAWTVFATATCGTLPTAAITCAVAAQPAAGATGVVEWRFTGPLESGGAGTVRLTVVVQ